MNTERVMPLLPAVACLSASPVAQDNYFKVLRLLAANSQLSQRELSKALGVSVGKTNYCVKALLDKGLIKMERFNKNPSKIGYSYLLTPSGVAEKAVLTARFLKRKMAEYEHLQAEIAWLQLEVGSEQSGISREGDLAMPGVDKTRPNGL